MAKSPRVDPTTATAETSLQQARRHVREAERRLKQQTALVARLQTRKQPTEQAELLLEAYREFLRHAQHHLALAEDEYGTGAHKK